MTPGVPGILVPPQGRLGTGGDDAAFDGLAADQLTNTRKAAENWRTGLAGLVTLVTAIVVFKGREKFDDLSDGYKWAALAAIVIAVLTGIAGLWRLLQGAYGEPSEVTRAEVNAEGGVAGWRARQAEEAINAFKQGRILAVVSALAVAVALVLGLLSPKAPPAFAKVAYLAGSPPKPAEKCGEIESSRSGYIKFKDEPQVITLRKVTSLKIVDSCGS